MASDTDSIPLLGHPPESLIGFVFMATEQDEFGVRYAELGDAELLVVARDYDALTEPAQAALRAEFAKRGMEAPLVEEGTEVPEAEARKLVTLRRYRDLSEAIVARGMLESAGITVYLQDENLVRLDWQVSNFIGGIRLQVEESDAAAAQELLEQPVPESIPFAGWSEFEQPRCPRCGSVEITFEGASRGAAVTGLWMAGLPLPQGHKSWSCASCGARWEDTDA
jgi:hypothetical protein